MELEVLMSCMNERDFSKIDQANLSNVKTLIINQTDKDEILRLDDKHRMINTTTKGLSISRNIAINNSEAEICLLCDDDERLIDDLQNVIINAYKELEDADIVAFGIIGRKNKFKKKIKRLSKLELLKLSSVQISFKRESIVNKICFDPYLGAGTGNGAGEENKFLLDAYRQGKKIYYYATDILVLNDEGSNWFNGFNEEYFYKRGSTTRYVYGALFSIIYSFYFILTKHSLYNKDISMVNAFFYWHKGMIENKIQKEKNNH